MKKILFFVCFITCFEFVCAQTKGEGKDKKKKIEEFFAAVLGLNLYTIGGDYGTESSGMLAGIQVGFMFKIIDFNDTWGARAEVDFSQQGSKFGESSSGKDRLNYINVPIVLRYQHPSGFYAEGGLQPGFLISAKSEYMGQTQDIKDEVKSFDFGLPFGVGYQFKNHIGIGARVIPGMTHISENSDNKGKNFGLNLRGSYAF